MAHAATRDRHIIVLHHDARLVEFMCGNQLAQVKLTFVNDASVDVEFLVFKKILRQLLQPRGSISINMNRPASNPRVIDQWAVLEIVIRMVMSNENVA